jgi:predicted Co/Zn/Cd cation transporter (cation efflux family)
LTFFERFTILIIEPKEMKKLLPENKKFFQKTINIIREKNLEDEVKKYAEITVRNYIEKVGKVHFCDINLVAAGAVNLVCKTLKNVEKEESEIAEMFSISLSDLKKATKIILGGWEFY